MDKLQDEMNKPEETLDPENWSDITSLGQEMVTDMMKYLQSVRERPTWQPTSNGIRDKFTEPLPQDPNSIKEVYEEFKEYILPYPVGNIHPRFWGWVFGTGTPFGMLADMLMSAMNSNALGGDQSPSYVENQVVDWCKQMINFNPDASGVLTNGCTMANLVGLTVARNSMAGFDVRKEGLQRAPKPFRFYASSEVHSCNKISLEMLGLGWESLRKIPVDDNYSMKTELLVQAIKEDRENGWKPVCVIGTAGTVNTGAFDDFEAIAQICKRENLWFHIDGAFGIFGVVSDVKDSLQGYQKADSLAFDLHKWMYMPYDVGCVLVQNEKVHRETFSYTPEYLEHTRRGVASKANWFSDYGIQLSRGFRALKVWMSLKENGFKKYTRLIQQNIDQARYLAKLIDETPHIERLAPVPLNIVCLRYKRPEWDETYTNEFNEELLVRIHESGAAVPSQTNLNGKIAIRVAITNHRSRKEDFDYFIQKCVEIAEELI